MPVVTPVKRPAAALRLSASVRRVDLKVGFACNNRCVFCAQGEKRAQCGALPAGELYESLKRLRARATALVLTGGEPSVHKKILVLVRAARQLGFTSVQLQTNGRLLAYPAVVRALLEVGVTEFAPSLHGARAETHDALTQAPGSFEESVRGIANAVASGVPVVTNSVIARSNLDELPALVLLLGGLGVRAAQLAFVHPVGTALERFDEVVPTLASVVAPLRAARDMAQELRVRLVTEAVPLCFLRGMQELAVEARIPETIVVEPDSVLDYSEWRTHEGKSHGEPCVGCAVRDRCEGPWREYPERRGWLEFVPL